MLGRGKEPRYYKGMKTLKIALGLVAFLLTAGAIVALGRDRLPQTSKIDIKINSCEYDVAGDLKVKKDQNMALTVSSVQGGEVHLHGYDLKKTLIPGQSETFNFRAVQSGVFDFEQHGCDGHILLVVLNSDGSEPNIKEHQEEDEKSKNSESKEAETEPHQD